MTKAETIFQKELSLIHDKDIKQFVITCFDKLCPDYFWTCPCSTTGKYHPQVSLGVGGLVRHTKLAVWWGIELLKALGTSSELKDIAPDRLQDEVIATLLLHDMVKNGKGLNAQGYPLDRGVTGTHGVMLTTKILKSDIPGIHSYDRILVGITAHMGIWTTDPMRRPDVVNVPDMKAFAQLIHLADYCASRKVDDIYSKLENKMNKILERVDYSCPMTTCKYTCSLDMKPAQERIENNGEFAIPPYMCPNPEGNHECHNPDSVGLNINLIFEQEKTNDPIKKSTVKTEVSQSPPCPGVRST